MKAVLALSLVLLSGSPAAAQTDDRFSDIVTVTTPAGDAVYALEAGSGHVFFTTVPSRLPASIALDSMAGLQLPRGVTVAAMAAWRDRLVFVDVGATPPALRQLDLQSGAIHDIPMDITFERPTAMAISPAGEIAITDQARHATFWVRDQEPTRVVPWPDGVARPDHIEFDGKNLVALDADARRIVNLTGSGTHPLLPGLGAFSLYRGVYYLSDGAALFALAPRGVPRRVPCAACPATAIRATAQRLFLFNAANREVAILARPVPIGVSIETSFADGQQALAALYDYLAGRGLLSVKDYVSPRAFDRVIDAVRAAGATVPLPDGSPDRVPDTLAAVLCRVNAGACRQASSFVNAPVAAGATLTIPDYTVQTFIRPDTVDLHGTAVAELLRGVRSFDANAGRLEYVQDLNAGSFENALARQGLVVASPARGDIFPGTFITVSGGNELAGRDLRAVCGITLPTVDRATPVDLPDRVNHVAFKDFVPLGTNRDGSPKDLGVKDGDLYVMSFRRTKIQQLDTESAQAPEVAARLAACMKRLASRPATAPEPLLVVEALRVEGALYDFYDPPKRTAFEQPFYLAYRAVPVSAFANRSIRDALATTTLPWTLKPGGPQDLLSRRTGTIDLPTIGWSLTALVPADDLERADSPLHALEAVPEGRILFLSRELAPSAAASLPGSPQDDEPTDLDKTTVERMKEERRNLLAAIEYHDIERESRAPVKIALGEANVDKEHPAMAEEIGGVVVSAFWTQATPDAAFVRHQIAPRAASNPKKRKFKENDDHGVHVAGLLAARESAVLPGLVPNAELFIIDTATVNPSDLHKSIVQATNQGVKVFNLSQSFERLARETQDNIRVDFKKAFERQLFIVAAGDGGLDLSDHEIPPIGWMRDVRSHMIGVGMSTHDGQHFQREAPDPDKPDARMSVSNVGQEYIQLAAPGEGIFSLGSKNTYTFATGTSQSAPQVTAAAAMLTQLGQYTANQIKARLIYTASWLDAKGYIWGGRLNIHRAVWHPSRNLYIGASDTNGPAVSAEFDPLMEITIGGSRQMAEPDGAIALAPPKIPFADVLRLTSLSDGRGYRVHFIDRSNSNRLRIIDEAEVHGIAQFTAKSAARWDPVRKEFVDIHAPDEGRDISEFMWDYVARVPAVCELQTGPCNPTIVF
jgi:subtilisin family serine protease